MTATQVATYATRVEPFLVFRRTGKTIALVLAGGFGGGTVLLGLMSAASALNSAAILPAVKGYLLAALPFFVAGALLATCRRELWVVPDAKAVRMLTFRPWHFSGPRIEQAKLDEYTGLCTVSMTHRTEAETLAVALITGEGDRVPVKEFAERDAAEAFALELAEATGLPHVRAQS